MSIILKIVKSKTMKTKLLTNKFKKMKKNLKITLLTLLLVTFFACSNDESQITDEISNVEVSKLIQNKLGYVQVVDASLINTVKSKSNFDSNTLYYKSLDDNSFVTISTIGNKYYLEKGIVKNDEFIIENNFELTDNMDDNGFGNLIIKNIDENITISQSYSDGIFTNKVTSSSNGFAQKSLCQREEGESFSDCNNRETDEFCDDFVSTVAYITNPTIPILIAALCTC